METEIIEQVVTSVEFWKDYEKIGEEVRPLEDAIRNQILKEDIDPVMEFLLDVINKYPNDYDLGKIIKSVYIPLKLIIDDSENTN
jgi:hypothetical protein